MPELEAMKNDNSKVIRYYIILNKSDGGRTFKLRRFWRTWDVTEAGDVDQNKIKVVLRLMQACIVVLTIFVIGAINDLRR